MCGRLRMSSSSSSSSRSTSSSLASGAVAGALCWCLLRKPFISNAHRDARQIHWDGEPPLNPLDQNGAQHVHQDYSTTKPVSNASISHTHTQTHPALDRHQSSRPDVLRVFVGLRKVYHEFSLITQKQNKVVSSTSCQKPAVSERNYTQKLEPQHGNITLEIKLVKSSADD